MSPVSSHAGCSQGSYNSDTFNDLHCNAVTQKSSSLRRCLCVRCAMQRLPTLYPMEFIGKIQAIQSGSCTLPVMSPTGLDRRRYPACSRGGEGCTTRREIADLYGVTVIQGHSDWARILRQMRAYIWRAPETKPAPPYTARRGSHLLTDINAATIAASYAASSSWRTEHPMSTRTPRGTGDIKLPAASAVSRTCSISCMRTSSNSKVRIPAPSPSMASRLDAGWDYAVEYGSNR
jgi:hypothetical protein